MCTRNDGKIGVTNQITKNEERKKERKKGRKKERKRKAFRITTYASYGMKRGCYIMKNVHV